MTKEVQMAFRVEPELRDSFAEAANRDHRPAAQILRELMRLYVNQSKERGADYPVENAISITERRRRESAVNFARASIGLEGFKTTKEDEAHARRFIEGSIELADFVKIAHAVDQER